MTDRSGAAREVFFAFLRLGLTSFGGPVAHIGYFRREFIERRRWISDADFMQLFALSQVLPGPSSSQMAFAIGRRRAGWMGALAAFAGFTAPSAAILFALASVAWGASTSIEWAMLDGLKLAAVAVVSHALIRMAGTVRAELRLVGIGVAVLAMLALINAAWIQIVALVAGAVMGAALAREKKAQRPPALNAEIAEGAAYSVVAGALGAFLLGSVLAALWASPSPSLTSVFSAFWGAGSLVFGGGHVVLPLLDATVLEPEWMSNEVFVAGYGAAQAIPGPLFSFAAFLGAEIPTGHVSLVGALVALFAIFTPGFLLMSAALPLWSRLTANPRMRGALAGVNAAVVGLLAAALYDPVMASGIVTWSDAVIAAVGLALLWNEKRSAIVAVAWCVGAAVALQTFFPRT